MNTLLNDDRDEYLDERETPHGQRDREITLGTMTILGIFFALAVLCAVFFGFGYSTGRRQPNTIAAVPSASSNAYTTSGSKPSAANTASDPIPNPPAANTAYEPVSVPSPKAAPVTRLTSSEADGAVVGVPLAPRPAAAAVLTAAPVAPVTASPAANGSFMVQIAAVSHQEDADLLVTTLKRVHYNVAVHQEPQDKLLHVQIGPFASRADAMAMRQRLQGDGFNAIVK